MVADPVQVAGDAGEAIGQARGAAAGGHKGGDTDQLGAVVEDQWAARVAGAGGLAAGGGGADDVVGDHIGSIDAGALVTGDDLRVHAVQVVGDATAIARPAPSGG